MKNNNWFLTTVLLLVLIAIVFWWMKFSSEPVSVNIPAGSNGRAVSRILKGAGLISSERFFLLVSRVMGTSKKFKEGIYDISPKTSIFGIVRIISEGKSRLFRITVPEGYTSAQIAELLFSTDSVRFNQFNKIVQEKKLEGYLFPQTYFFDPNLSPDKIIDIMVNEFKKNYTPELRQRAEELKISDLQVLTLASIIEKEAKVASERPRISAVFHNRLKKNWYLESCATVLYSLGEHKERLMNKDLKVESPYNTYRHLGLPPGPICNPGIDSIKAALYPLNTNEMYFVAASSGTHAFSCTLEEHLINKKVMKSERRKNKKHLS